MLSSPADVSAVSDLEETEQVAGLGEVEDSETGTGQSADSIDWAIDVDDCS